MADAQSRLRQLLGRDVRFYGPAAMIYDPSIPASEFDDEGIPLDPLAGATPVASADVGIDNLTIVGSAHVNVLFQPLAAMRRDEVEEQPTGWRSRLNKDLILDIADAPQTTSAEYFEIGTFTRDSDGNILYDPDGSEQQWTSDDGELWKIVNSKTDGFGGLQRFLIFGQGTR
jgi:hypothetical protein